MQALPFATEQLISISPVTVKRRVKWGECDPAGVVYTATFSDYVISAAELFYGAILGSTPQRAKSEHGFGTPTRALSFVFSRSLYPDDEFDMTVTVTNIRVRSYVLDITARSPDGQIIFVAQLTPVCVARSERRAIVIPAEFRSALERYRQAFGSPPQDSRAED